MKTLIRGGRVIDPANAVDSKLNILISGGRIERLCTDELQADRVIDAEGRIVTPGFVDLHMHEDPIDPDGRIRLCIYRSMLRMGVTTAVGGNCGSNACRPADYLDALDRGAPINVGLLAGHGWARAQSGAADKYAAATETQKETMVRLLKEALDAGCLGVSFGLRYFPGTDRDEFYRAAAVCRGTGKLIAAHVRDDADAIFESVEEVAGAAKAYDLPVQISHIGSMGGFGQMEALLRRTDAMRADGLNIMLDCYPYDAFCTGLGETTYDDGWLERYHCDYGVLEYCEGTLRGKRATAADFAELRKTHPEYLTVCHVMKPEDIDTALSHPSVMVASDGILNDGQGHPRAAGTFPRVYSEYVRRGKLSLYDAAAKMTAVPAARLGLDRKGRLNAGADADLVIFDPERIADRATFAEPLLPPVGIDRVIIAGETAVLDGEIVREDLGRSVRK